MKMSEKSENSSFICSLWADYLIDGVEFLMIFTYLRKARFVAEKMAPFTEFYDEAYGRGSEKSAKCRDFYSSTKWDFLISLATSPLWDDNSTNTVSKFQNNSV